VKRIDLTKPVPWRDDDRPAIQSRLHQRRCRGVVRGHGFHRGDLLPVKS